MWLIFIISIASTIYVISLWTEPGAAPFLPIITQAQVCSKAIFGNFVAPSILPISAILCEQNCQNWQICVTCSYIESSLAPILAILGHLFLPNMATLCHLFLYRVFAGFYCQFWLFWVTHFCQKWQLCVTCSYIESLLAFFFANFGNFESPIFDKNGNFRYCVFASILLPILAILGHPFLPKMATLCIVFSLAFYCQFWQFWVTHFCQKWQFYVSSSYIETPDIKLPFSAILRHPFFAKNGNFMWCYTRYRCSLYHNWLLRVRVGVRLGLGLGLG